MLCLSAGYIPACALFRAAFLQGEPVIFPTDTIYGMGALVSSKLANEKIYRIKHRPMDKPMPLLVGSLEGLFAVAEEVGADVRKWLGTLWPGPYTIIFKARPWLDPLYTMGGTVAVRMVGGWLGETLKTLRIPVTATSVNDSGEQPLINPDEICETYRGSVPFMLYGRSAGRKSSAIIDITGGEPEIVRDV